MRQIRKRPWKIQIQDKYKEIIDDPGYLESVLRRGREQAEAIANQTLTKVKTAFGYSLPV